MNILVNFKRFLSSIEHLCNQLTKFQSYLWMSGICIVLIANRNLFTVNYVVPWDGFDWLWPYFRWYGSALREGYFPDFFPNILAGYPSGSNIQTGIYNPLYLLCAFIFPDSVLSINAIYIILQSTIYLLGYAISRAMKMSPITSVYLGLALTASGYVVGHASHIPFLSTFAGLLGCFLGIQLATTKSLFTSFVVTLISVFQILTSGYPQNIFFGAQCLALYWAYLFYSRVDLRKNLRTIIYAALSGVALSAPALIHFANLVLQSSRGAGLTPSAAMQNSLPTYALLNLGYPTWIMGFTEPTMERFHLLNSSIIFLVIAIIIAIVKKIHSKIILTLFILFILLTLLSLGGNGPLPIRQWLAEHISLYRMSRHPSGEHRGIALFLLALISCFGLQALLEKTRYRFLNLLIILVIFIDFLLIMDKLDHLRYSKVNEKYRGHLGIYQIHFKSSDQYLIDAKRNCAPDGEDANSTALWVQRDKLIPNHFYWNGFEGLRDKIYDESRLENQDILCGPSRLWSASNREPKKYNLISYEPSRVKLTIPFEAQNAAIPERLIWADYNDGYWKLYINGKSHPLEMGPAKMRLFTALPGDKIEMVYMGPLSQLWRNRSAYGQ